MYSDTCVQTHVCVLAPPFILNREAKTLEPSLNIMHSTTTPPPTMTSLTNRVQLSPF
ncbi:hypothetical protein EXN66_Car000138 [Channa argus]|uniref:Uncharacterized protein n=1 Tax=Channa argus TaxID=215402 RepID=A0A6G1QY17_CHAAH|nr:hypothetical protein EXN66_Car000138 [Channa argus]